MAAEVVDLIVGAPVWDRAWSLPLWFSSLRANVDPARTGLAFVIPASDVASREAVAALSQGFAWVEVMRDRGEQMPREERVANRHRTLAMARNQILRVVAEARPRHYLSWDTDLLVPPGTVQALAARELPLITVWTWLNRQPPRRVKHFDGKRYNEVYWQPPACATAMAWDPVNLERAVHYRAEEFKLRSQGLWRTGVALAWQLMDGRAYGVASYRPHHDGEDVPFSVQLERRGIPRYCYGDARGVHLYDPGARNEIEMGWPGVMALADELPLAAEWTEPRSPEYEAFGFFGPTNERTEDADVAA